MHENHVPRHRKSFAHSTRVTVMDLVGNSIAFALTRGEPGQERVEDRTIAKLSPPALQMRKVWPPNEVSNGRARLDVGRW